MLLLQRTRKDNEHAGNLPAVHDTSEEMATKSVKCRADVCASIATVIALYLLVPGIGRGAQNSNQPESERLLHAASAAIHTGNYPEAERLYTAALRQIGKEGGASARLPIALCGLGCVRRAAGQCGEAADLFLKAIQIMEAAPATEPEEFGGGI